ncbi:50S ribosomal protein L3 N(5)-glutamine methyltransferase [Cupriavidus sp. EM10]|uniref:50S ribosomal protein L3 N(5)-glutamine methyltransferase n=1 Tax=Cupriavidus sp. EM10 TaxID=2839983 RepID=UPI001C002EBC|nr:50S ribosomal protein L3 N(5)-glutamine methyltransferase [Cupriavidus sp. EM10]QWE95998.1 50S ribosomal protein L3 N(5)-glutamine methyltransferase [Cupriavidus sp. EM10]
MPGATVRHAYPSPLKTVRDLLRLAVSRFTAAKLSFGHGSANAYDEAAYLVLHTLSLPLDTLDPFLDARLLPEEIDAVLKVIDRRVTERVPAAYITHEAFMHGLRFYVDSRVIVPRSFIGELLQDGLEPWLGDIEQIGPVLELCTGSGCLPIIAAHVWPNARIDAVDISSDALAVARRNVADYKMEDRIALYEGDLYAPLPSGATYDVILTNPPYVNEQSMRDLPAEYLAEPRLALAGGDDGMDVVRRIVAGARKRLNPGGVLVVEIGNEHDNVEAAFPDLDIVWLSVSAGDDQVFLVTYDALPD